MPGSADLETPVGGNYPTHLDSQALLQVLGYAHSEMLIDAGIRIETQPLRIKGCILDPPKIRYKPDPNSRNIVVSVVHTAQWAYLTWASMFNMEVGISEISSSTRRRIYLDGVSSISVP